MKTIFIEDDIHRLLKLKAITEHHSLSETVNSLLRKQLLEEKGEGVSSVWLKLKGMLKGDKEIDKAMEELAKSWTQWKPSV